MRLSHTVLLHVCIKERVTVCARACGWRHKGLSEGFPRTEIFDFLETNLGCLPGRRRWQRKKHKHCTHSVLQETFDLISQEKDQSNCICSGFKGIVSSQ